MVGGGEFLDLQILATVADPVLEVKATLIEAGVGIDGPGFEKPFFQRKGQRRTGLLVIQHQDQAVGGAEQHQVVGFVQSGRFRIGDPVAGR